MFTPDSGLCSVLSMSNITMEQAIQVARATCDAILLAVEDGPRPSGEIYALLMPSGVPLNFYEKMLGILVEGKRITVKNHLVSKV